MARIAVASSTDLPVTTGTAPTDIKGFKLVVGNPYPDRMTFVITPMNPEFTAVVDDAVIHPLSGRAHRRAAGRPHLRAGTRPARRGVACGSGGKGLGRRRPGLAFNAKRPRGSTGSP